MIELYENLPQKDADLCSLVLRASFIPHRVIGRGKGFSVLVGEHNYEDARRTMEQYFAENRTDRAVPAEEPPEAAHGYAGVWIAVILGAIHFYVYNTGFARDVWDKFGASASRINHGEWFRVVTALTLHADWTHIAGNMAGMAVFGTAVAQVSGWGAGFLMILLGGALGNLVNAFMHTDAHLSIGASTAVFGAVGILSAYQFVRKRKREKRRSRAWLPVLGGIALLGLLGGGPHVDLGAHLFGFLAGLAVGFFYTVFADGRLDEKAQWVCGLLGTGIVAFSWVVGYLYL